MVPAFCDVDSGLWRQTTYDRAVGCIHYTLVNTPCPGADKKGPKDKDSEMKGKEGAEGGRDPLVPVVCDRETHKFRRPNPGEQPDAYLPARYLGRPCHRPKR
jgi:hypothetical protein